METDKHACVGFLEMSSIPRGIQVTDGLLKKASVRILFSHPTSSGKYLVCFRGEVEDAKSSVAEGRRIGGDYVLDYFLLPSIHPEILPAIEEKPRKGDGFEALGIIETSTCASCVTAADKALKTSKVRLVRIRLGRGIGGKAYFVIEGEIGEIESAMSAAMRQAQSHKASILDHVVISQAAPELPSIFD